MTKKKSSPWLLLIGMLIIALVIVYIMRSQSGKVGNGSEATSGLSEMNQRERPKVAESETSTDNGRSLPNQFAVPFFSDENATPVAFKGIVLNQEDRTPIKGARVRVNALSSSETLERTTGADGIFVIEAPASYRFELSAEAEGYGPYLNDALVVTRPEYAVEIPLSKFASIKGRVVDPQSRGIQGATVAMFLSQQGPPSMSTTTDAQGKFLLNSIMKDAKAQLLASHPGYASIGSVGAMLPQNEEVIIQLQAATSIGSLAGIVTDAGSRPIAGAKITLSRRKIGESSEAITDARGEYRFSRLGEGAYLVQCSANDFIDAGTNQELASVYSGRESRLDFRLKAGLQIRGVVVNKENRPVANVNVQYRRANALAGRSFGRGGRMDFPGQPGSNDSGSAVSDSRGIFQISGLAEGAYSISIQKRDFLDFTAVMQPSNQLQTITLDSGLSVRGAARDMQGRAIEQFSLTFQSTTRRFFELSCDFMSTDGFFEMRGLPRDNYAVTLRGGDRRRARYSGAIDLQDAMQVLLMIGEKPNPAPNSLTITARSR